MAIQVVEVTWEDIAQDASWATDTNCVTVTSIGYLAQDDERYLKIGSSINEDGEIAGILAMPRGCVLRVKHLSREASPP